MLPAWALPKGETPIQQGNQQNFQLGQPQGQNVPSIIPFNGLVKLFQEPILDKKQAERGLEDRIMI
ncbi:hypothetical protein DP73_04840 [Desulfosporosinus sp. HMP52]|uniref:hypothetical protein n=1 Tax=Desulfosporosinus sp. HMP52 TaxID=1487923 RepID=UPI00051FF305|nr:hypothetical protein [Desulfosporosinus sp. HMP52]KGK91168.1 hypothetical protein DP73_04840 [Desulfosporosinus sp. HMP52]